MKRQINTRHGDAVTRRRGEIFRNSRYAMDRFLRVAVSPLLCVLLLLLTTHCLLLTAHAQPGVPTVSSPLYGARPETGKVATGLPKALEKVGIDQRLNEQLPLDAVFKDEQGREVRLGEYFKGKPVVVAFVYYSCPMLCNQVLNGMLSSFRGVTFNVGERFEVGPSVSIHARRQACRGKKKLT